MKRSKLLVGIAAVLFLLAFPLVVDSSLDSLAIPVLLLTSAAAAWNIFSGNTGYISLGSASYYGIGAYALALSCQRWHVPGGWGPFLLVPLAGLFCAVFAVPVGWIALRVQRHTFLVMTIAIFFLVQSLSYNLGGITGGSMGIFLPLPDWSADIFDLPFYYVAGVVLLLVTALSWWVRHSKFGLELLAIRDDEDRARGLGIKTGHFKLVAYVLSASLFGVVGAVYVYFSGSVTPLVAFDPSLNLTVVVACFLGGIGTITGPIVGGILLLTVQSVLIQQFGVSVTGLDQVLFGGFLLVVILFLPSGLVPTLSKWWHALHAGQRMQEVAIPPITSSTSPAAPSLVHVSGSETKEEISKPVDQPIRGYNWVVRHQFREQHVPLSSPDTMLLRVRANRLTPLATSSANTVAEPLSTLPVGSWRCPSCRKPFILKGGMCYCPRCDIMRPIGE